MADEDLSGWNALLVLVAVTLLAGCTVIAFNRGPVEVKDRDDHSIDNDGTNRSHMFDVQLSPR